MTDTVQVPTPEQRAIDWLEGFVELMGCNTEPATTHIATLRAAIAAAPQVAAEPVNQQLLEALRLAEQVLRGKAYDEEGYCLDPDLAEDADKARAALQAALSALPKEQP